MKRLSVFLFFCGLFCSNAAFFDAYQAHQLYATGDVEAAKKAYMSMVIDDFSNWRALYNLGTIALNQKLYPESIAHLEKALAVQPDNPEIQERLAIARKLHDEEQKKKEDQEQKEQDNDSSNDQQENNSEEDQKQGKSTPPDKDEQNAQNKQSEDKQDNQQQPQDDAQHDNNQRRNEPKDQKTDAEKKVESDQQKKDEELSLDQQLDNKEVTSGRNGASGGNVQKSREPDPRLSEQDAYLLNELDKIDQHVQKEMIRYAISQNEPKHVAIKNW